MPHVRSTTTRRFALASLTVLALCCAMLATARSASAEDLCVGTHPDCSGSQNFPGTTTGLLQALTASQNTFAGPDTVWIGSGTYATPLFPTGFGAFQPEADLHVKGEGPDSTKIDVSLANQTGLGFSNDSDFDVTVSGLSVVSKGRTGSTGLFGNNVDFQHVAVETEHSTSAVKGLHIVGNSTLVDSTVRMTGPNVVGVYMEDSSAVRDSELVSSDGVGQGIAGGGSGTITIERTEIRNVRTGAAWDLGDGAIRDTLVQLSDYNGAVGINATNSNDCNGCSVGLVAFNTTIVGNGPNQSGIYVGGSGADGIVESGIGSVSDTLIDLTGSDSYALYCVKSGNSTSSSLTTRYLAARASQIVTRDPGCTGTDTGFVDLNTDPPQYLFPAIGDFRPTTASSVVDAGDPDTYATPVDEDLDGLSRVVDGNGDTTAEVDIGAYEYQAAMAPSKAQISASPNPASVGELISFSALALEPDGGVVDYAWDFGDGNSDTGNNLQHQYSSPGIYTVTVVATDDELEQSTTTLEVQVGSDPPSLPTVDSDLDVTVRNTDITFTASGSVDLDGDSFTYEWTFSDGGVDSGATVTRPATTMNHDPGPTIFTATVRAVDDNGTESSPASVDVTILNRFPDATGLTKDRATAYRGEEVSFSAQATDPENDTMYYTWDLGDGSSPIVGAVSPTVQRSYSTLGAKTISFTVRDPYDGQPADLESIDSQSTTIQIINRDPSVGSIAHSGTLKTGDVQGFSLTASDGDGDPIIYTWNYGDGTSENTGASGSASHAYTTPGTYTVTASVADNQGSTVVATRTITVASRQATITLGKPNKTFWLRSKGFTLGGKAPYAFIPIKTSEPVSLSISLTHVKGGYKKGKSCVKKKAGNKRCDLKLAGVQKLDLLDTSSNLMFGGKWRGKNLKPGSYIVTLTPADGGPAKSVTIKLVKKKK